MCRLQGRLIFNYRCVGCGKTLLANAIAGELKVPFLRISAPEIVSGMSGESEQKIRALFNEAIVRCCYSIDRRN